MAGNYDSNCPLRGADGRGCTLSWWAEEGGNCLGGGGGGGRLWRTDVEASCDWRTRRQAVIDGRGGKLWLTDEEAGCDWQTRRQTAIDDEEASCDWRRGGRLWLMYGKAQPWRTCDRVLRRLLFAHWYAWLYHSNEGELIRNTHGLKLARCSSKK